MEKYALVITFFFYSIGLLSQSGYTNAFIEADKVWKQNKSNYYSPIQYLKQLEKDSLSKFEKNICYDALATYNAMISNFEETIQYDILRRNQGRYNNSNTVDSTFSSNKMSSAKKEILNIAKEYDVIMINESHHTPYHRAFVSELLQELHELGFNYLALEALSHKQEINERKYPCFEDGFYTKEPLFGEMIRQAVKLNYKLVAYEAVEKCDPKQGKKKDRYYCQRFRDSIQAMNIYEIKKNDKNAKILVLAGYSHIKKNSKPHKTRMAEYFKRMSGIDPLSIDQTVMMDLGDTSFLNPYYKYALDSLPKEPVVYLDQNGKIWNHSKRVDITIFSPKLSKSDNRYSFYNLVGKIKYSPEIDDDEIFFVQAFYEEEKGNTIPADQYFRDKNKKYLYLYPGSYRIQFRDKEGVLISEIKKEILENKSGD